MLLIILLLAFLGVMFVLAGIQNQSIRSYIQGQLSNG